MIPVPASQAVSIEPRRTSLVDRLRRKERRVANWHAAHAPQAAETTVDITDPFDAFMALDTGPDRSREWLLDND